MLSALIHSVHSYPAMPLAEQLVHQRYVHPGPLVLRTGLLKFPTPATDRDRTVSRRSEPSSRTTLMGEQPNPWDLLQPPGCDEPTSRCQTSPSMWTLGGDKPVIPRVSFYPLSDGPSMRYHRITKSDFRPCSTCMSCNQASFCLYTLRTISDRAEETFERLRYFLGGDRPSQTAHLTVFQDLIQGLWLGSQYYKGGIPRVTPHRLASMLHSLPPILYM